MYVYQKCVRTHQDGKYVLNYLKSQCENSSKKVKTKNYTVSFPDGTSFLRIQQKKNETPKWIWILMPSSDLKKQINLKPFPYLYGTASVLVPVEKKNAYEKSYLELKDEDERKRWNEWKRNQTCHNHVIKIYMYLCIGIEFKWESLYKMKILCRPNWNCVW